MREALRTALVEDQTPVLVFPEGTATERGPPLPFKRGALLSAHALGVPVQPCTLWYSEAIGLPYESNTLDQLAKMVQFPMQVCLRVGDTVFPQDFERAEDFAEAIEARITRDFHAMSTSKGGRKKE